MASKFPGWFAGWFGARKVKAPERPVLSNPYRAVSVLPGPEACAAAYSVSGQRFLSREAPRLPLPNCNFSTCNCRFKHHKDRRAGPRRGIDVGLLTSSYTGKERRHTHRGRRAEDRF